MAYMGAKQNYDILNIIIQFLLKITFFTTVNHRKINGSLYDEINNKEEQNKADNRIIKTKYISIIIYKININLVKHFIFTNILTLIFLNIKY